MHNNRNVFVTYRIYLREIFIKHFSRFISHVSQACSFLLSPLRLLYWSIGIVLSHSYSAPFSANHIIPYPVFPSLFFHFVRNIPRSMKSLTLSSVLIFHHSTYRILKSVVGNDFSNSAKARRLRNNTDVTLYYEQGHSPKSFCVNE